MIKEIYVFDSQQPNSKGTVIPGDRTIMIVADNNDKFYIRYAPDERPGFQVRVTRDLIIDGLRITPVASDEVLIS